MITRLLSHQPFLDRVARDICANAQGHEATVRTANGEVTGEIKGFQLIGTPLFADEGTDCVGNTCSLPFSGRGEASGYGESSAGDGWLPFAAPVEYFGQVDLSWPDDEHVQTEADFREVYSHVTIRVVLESVGGGEAATRPQMTAPAL